METLFDKQIIDLTLTYTEGIPGYDWTIAKSLEKDGWNARKLCFYSHSGTHMDAPTHFGVNQTTIDTFQPQQLMGRAWVIQLSNLPDKALIEVKDLEGIKELYQAGDSLLFHTGWSQHLNTPRYRNALPRISEDLALWCAKNRVKMLGVEPPSVADVHNLEEVTKIHQILLGGDVIIIEGLTNLHLIQGEKVWLIALPLKIQGGDGSPARVIAFEY